MCTLNINNKNKHMKRSYLFLNYLLILIFFLFIECRKEDKFESRKTPVLRTLDVDNITAISARCIGKINSLGDLEVSERGICWSFDSFPSISNKKAYDSGDTGVFKVNIDDLFPESEYYAWAYIINTAGVWYGNTIRFTTPQGELPVVETAEITGIFENSAICGGYVMKEGTTAVEARGVCWASSPNPTLDDDYTLDGAGQGVFVSIISNLNAGTKYFVRAYATNKIGTSYGNEMVFIAGQPFTSPKVNISGIPNITHFSAIIEGEVTSDGGKPVISKGICWSRNPLPTTADLFTNEGPGTGYFSSFLNNLKMGTKYYARAYATNDIATSYSNEIVFTTLSYQIGDNYEGGIIAYIFKPGEPGFLPGETHGIVIIPYDLPLSKWNALPNMATGANKVELKTGTYNTEKIIAAHGYTQQYAASHCYNLIVGIYNDWVLPSKDDLLKIYEYRYSIPGINYTASYWSSSEVDLNHAYSVNFNTGDYETKSKQTEFSVRAVRYF